MGKWSFLIDDISPSSLEINRSESCVVLFFNVKISIDWWFLYTERELDKNPSGHITCEETLSANHISRSKAQHSTNIHLHKSSLVFVIVFCIFEIVVTSFYSELLSGCSAYPYNWQRFANIHIFEWDRHARKKNWSALGATRHRTCM